MADRQDRVVAALNFLTGEGIAYHPDGCDQDIHWGLLPIILARVARMKNLNPQIAKVWVLFW